ncbi:PEP-CTERM sorting domain-containing protein [Methylophilus sp. 3sh_L]|uniref:PEP-CTERM sorting domain-containing protein n=1 Tax=Methylophilus sp. 3sh_L TaxID=3377114 RepID=UPI00398F3C4F
MKKQLFLHLVLFFASIWTSNSFSEELFNNGVPIFATDRCISGPLQCGEFDGRTWVVYDDFTLSSNSVVTGFSNWNGFGSISDYLNTSWSIWSDLHSSPSLEVEGTLIASGNNVGEIKLSNGFNKVTIDGINVNLDAGIYWLGISHTLKSGSNPYTYVASDSQAPANGIQSIGTALTLMFGLESAFTVNGYIKNAPPLAVPEPSNSALLLVSLGVLIFTVNRRKFKQT